MQGLTPLATHLFSKYALRFGTNATFQVRRACIAYNTNGPWGRYTQSRLEPPPTHTHTHTTPTNHNNKQSWLADADGHLDDKRRLLAGLGAGVTEAILIVTPFDVGEDPACRSSTGWTR